MSDLGGEVRFACSVARRLQELGALCMGDRRGADSSNLETFNFETRYGEDAVHQLLDSADHPTGVVPARELRDAILDFDTAPQADLAESELEGRSENVEEKHEEEGEAGAERLESDNLAEATKSARFVCYLEHVNDLLSPQLANDPKPSKFLNRLLGVPTTLQRQVFAHYDALMQENIENAKKTGTYDEGVIDIQARKIALRGQAQVVATDPLSGAAATYHEVRCVRAERGSADGRRASERALVALPSAHCWQLELDRGLSFVKAKSLLDNFNAQSEDERNGFYMETKTREPFMALIINDERRWLSTKEKRKLCMIRPSMCAHSGLACRDASTLA